MYIATFILLLILVTESISKLGYSFISAIVYNWYTRLTNNEKLLRLKKLKRDLLKVKNELSQTSSQDEFAKWAKLRRKLDKGVSELEQLTSSIAMEKAAFEVPVRSALWFMIHGTRILVIFWYFRRAAFYLPPGWFGPAEEFLWLPYAPSGAVGIAIWMLACRQIFKQVFGLVKAFYLTEKKDQVPSSSSSSSFSPFNSGRKSQ